jgi:hypothetical protein
MELNDLDFFRWTSFHQINLYVLIGYYYKIQLFLYKNVFPLVPEEFEDTKRVIRIRKSKNYGQHNGQKKKDKRTKNNLQNIHIKLKIEEHEPN